MDGESLWTLAKDSGLNLGLVLRGLWHMNMHRSKPLRSSAGCEFKMVVLILLSQLESPLFLSGPCPFFFLLKNTISIPCYSQHHALLWGRCPVNFKFSYLSLLGKKKTFPVFLSCMACGKLKTGLLMDFIQQSHAFCHSSWIPGLQIITLLNVLSVSSYRLYYWLIDDVVCCVLSSKWSN